MIQDTLKSIDDMNLLTKKQQVPNEEDSIYIEEMGE